MRYGTPVPRCPEFNRTYTSGCRCAFCRTESGRRMNEYRERRRVGAVDTLVPSEPTRRAIRAAVRRGMTQQQIVEMAHISKKTMLDIMGIPDHRIRSSVERKILEAIADPIHEGLRPSTLVPSKRSRQIVRSLSAQGWSKAHQQEIFAKNRGINGGFVMSVLITDMTRYSNEQELEWLAKQIGERIGPSIQAPRRSRALGFFPLKHYNVKGDLIVTSLSAEQRAHLRSVS